MRIEGNLKTWNDERGFGFIAPAQGGQDLFVHIKDFPAGSGRPQVGQALTFTVVSGADQKKRATAVQYPVRFRARPAPRSDAPAAWTLPRLLAIPAFAAICVYAAARWGFAPRILAAYLVLSVVALIAYAIDKSAAQSGRRRTPENTLHLIALAGGWPGALLAQQLLRHKTRKPGFMAVFWLTVVLNVAVLLAWQAGLLVFHFQR